MKRWRRAKGDLTAVITLQALYAILTLSAPRPFVTTLRLQLSLFKRKSPNETNTKKHTQHTLFTLSSQKRKGNLPCTAHAHMHKARVRYHSETLKFHTDPSSFNWLQIELDRGRSVYLTPPTLHISPLQHAAIASTTNSSLHGASVSTRLNGRETAQWQDHLHLYTSLLK